MRISILLFSCFLLCSCNKFLDVQPPKGNLSTNETFASDETATAAIMGLYIKYPNYFAYMATTYMGLYADELDYLPASTSVTGFEATLGFHESRLYDDNATLQYFWRDAYNFIYRSTLCINNIAASEGISAPLKKQLTAEATFLRALSYYNLVRQFKRVPLITGTDYRVNAVVPQSDPESIYAYIIKDIKDVITLLEGESLTAKRIRVTKYAAMALLACVELTHENWEQAALMSDEVIRSFQMESLPALSTVFRSNSTEAILHIEPNTETGYSSGAFQFIPASATVIPQYPVRTDLMEAFEPGDLRKEEWLGKNTVNGVDYYYPAKYKMRSIALPKESHVVLRLAEQYLIRAEAECHRDQLPQAIADVDRVRKRAGLPLIADTHPDINKKDLLEAIYRERRIELFAENGHRWYDLERTGKADDIMSTLKPATWASRGVLWPVPRAELDTNPFLEQNDEYK